MKIVLIHYTAPPIIGGVESVIGQHARFLANDGHHVSIIAGRGEQTDERIPFIKLPLVDSRDKEILAIKKDLDIGHIPEEFNPLVGQIKSQLLDFVADADWLIAHNVCSLNKNLALSAALKQISDTSVRPRFILWHHDLAWTTPRYRTELHNDYPWNLLSSDWQRAKQVVVSEARQNELAQLLNVTNERIQIIPNGVDATRFWKLDEETEMICRQLDLLSAEPLILLPVRITPRKNIELALKVLALLRKYFKNAKLLVTGPLGPHNPANVQYFDGLVSLRSGLHIEEAAHFLAEPTNQPLKDEVVADLYRIADLLFFPSKEEGFGIPILEAGLAGIPIFCADIAPLRELGGSQVNYFGLDDDPVQVSNQMIKSLESNSLFALRKRVLRDYTWEKIYMNHIAPLFAEA
jgi:glycosyltransferase involved in cell wall biosynthesis